MSLDIISSALDVFVKIAEDSAQEAAEKVEEVLSGESDVDVEEDLLPDHVDVEEDLLPDFDVEEDLLPDHVDVEEDLPPDVDVATVLEEDIDAEDDVGGEGEGLGGPAGEPGDDPYFGNYDEIMTSAPADDSFAKELSSTHKESDFFDGLKKDLQEQSSGVSNYQLASNDYEDAIKKLANIKSDSDIETFSEDISNNTNTNFLTKLEGDISNALDKSEEEEEDVPVSEKMSAAVASYDRFFTKHATHLAQHYNDLSMSSDIQNDFDTDEKSASTYQENVGKDGPAEDEEEVSPIFS